MRSSKLQHSVALLLLSAAAFLGGCGAGGELAAAKVESTRLQVQQVNQALALFMAQKGHCPAAVEELVEKRLLSAAPKDAWGGALVVDASVCTASSPGPDQKTGTPDDVR